MIQVNTADALANKSSQRIQSLIIVLKKLADAALQKVHCCIAALAIEKLGGSTQLLSNAGPNLLPWIIVNFSAGPNLLPWVNATIDRWFKPPPLDRRRVLAAHHLLPVRRLFFSHET